MATLAKIQGMLVRTAAGGATIAACGSVSAAEVPLTSASSVVEPFRIEVFENSRLGCGQGKAPWSSEATSTQCAFDTATRGGSLNAGQAVGSGSIEAYGVMARSTAGVFAPERLLQSQQQRANETTDFFLVGAKVTGFEGRLKLVTEFARTDHMVDSFLRQDWTLSDKISHGGSSALLRLDVILADQPGLRWSVSGQYRSVSDYYSVGRSPVLFRYYAMPGTRLSLSSVVTFRDIRLNARFEQAATPFGHSRSHRVGVDADGISVRFISRLSRVQTFGESIPRGSQTSSDSAYLDLEPNILADRFMPKIAALSFIMPTSLSLSYRQGVMQNLFGTTAERYRRTSFGIDAMWESPIGETSLSYWRDRRDGLTIGARSRRDESYQIDHGIRFGRWRFSADASLSRGQGYANNGYQERSWSFGQSIAYSAPNGPEFRLHLGQDRGAMRMLDDSYLSDDRYSQITASLDLSRYLQTRFERSDLRLTVDYRKTVDRSDGEFMLDEQVIDRWVDADRREGLLVSFGMKL